MAIQNRQKNEMKPIKGRFSEKISYPIHEGPTFVLFLCKSLVQNFKIFVFRVYCLCSYLQAYVVTISHLDTWFTLILLTRNILTLLK